jgi:hypothetical protein
LVVSAGAAIIEDVSGAILDVSAGATVVVSVEVDEVEPLLQAAKVPIAKTINNFFIVCVFCDVIFVLILEIILSNPAIQIFFTKSLK